MKTQGHCIFSHYLGYSSTTCPHTQRVLTSPEEPVTDLVEVSTLIWSIFHVPDRIPGKRQYTCVTVSQNLSHIVLYMLAHRILAQEEDTHLLQFCKRSRKEWGEVVNDTVPQQPKPIPGIRVETLWCRILGNGAWENPCLNIHKNWHVVGSKNL